MKVHPNLLLICTDRGQHPRTILGGLSPGRSVRGGRGGRRLVQLDRREDVTEVTSVRILSETTKRPPNKGGRVGMTHAIEDDGSEHTVLLRSRCPRCRRDVRFPLRTGHPETRQWSGEGCPDAPSIEVPRAVPR